MTNKSALILAAELPHFIRAEVKRPVDKLKALNIKEIKIPVGASTPFSALHISDTHIARVDNRDIERKIKLASKRSKLFPWGEHYFEEAIRYAKEHNMRSLEAIHLLKDGKIVYHINLLMWSDEEKGSLFCTNKDMIKRARNDAKFHVQKKKQFFIFRDMTEEYVPSMRYVDEYEE